MLSYCYNSLTIQSVIYNIKLISKIWFFLSTINEWNKLNGNIRTSESINNVKDSILNFRRPNPNSIFDSCDPKELGLITRLRVGLSHVS